MYIVFIDVILYITQKLVIKKGWSHDNFTVCDVLNKYFSKHLACTLFTTLCESSS